MAKKQQFTIYLDPAIMRALDAYAAERRKSKSLVAEAAITSFLTPDDSDRREAAIAKRLDRIVRVLERMERNEGVTLETVALFVRYWLIATPSLPEQTSSAARAKGAERYDRFLDALGRRLANGPGLLKEIAVDMRAGDEAAG